MWNIFKKIGDLIKEAYNDGRNKGAESHENAIIGLVQLAVLGIAVPCIAFAAVGCMMSGSFLLAALGLTVATTCGIACAGFAASAIGTLTGWKDAKKYQEKIQKTYDAQHTQAYTLPKPRLTSSLSDTGLAFNTVAPRAAGNPTPMLRVSPLALRSSSPR
jgi:hypothetical protein